MNDLTTSPSAWAACTAATTSTPTTALPDIAAAVLPALPATEAQCSCLSLHKVSLPCQLAPELH
eukprot:CAMPEP_0202880866 /NCGR_PEP_ID=MMETSP1391-20130828/35659_1 /ASSEMBLY_ACC=CAM_ASM_000867 /TAXON_ID=1034604 /ORGANISM="Chlamydomonas leiostraca, Strain SAG 11-49" /LENGTH=63 /DNA_ID=CAMNT_0049563437 /DNA_START=258 /DNA_END=449 /DNA_ORIENTATION=-